MRTNWPRETNWQALILLVFSETAGHFNSAVNNSFEIFDRNKVTEIVQKNILCILNSEKNNFSLIILLAASSFCCHDLHSYGIVGGFVGPFPEHPAILPTSYMQDCPNYMWAGREEVYLDRER